MKKLILGVAAFAAVSLTAGATMAHPYGSSYGYGYGYEGRYDHGRHVRSERYLRDSDRDGIPDVREWNRDRDRDGRPDQYDRHDNRRDRYGYSSRYDRSYGGYGYRGW